MYVAAAKVEEPFLAYALLKLAYSGPKSRVRNRICHFVTPADIDKVCALKTEIRIEAEDVLRTTRTLANTLQVPEYQVCGLEDNRFVKAFANLDIRVARKVLDRQEGCAKVYETLDAVVADFLVELASAFPNAVFEHYNKRWPPSASASASASDSCAAVVGGAVGLEEFQNGVRVDALGQLRDNGFDIGNHVAFVSSPHTEESILVIVRVAGTYVECQPISSLRGGAAPLYPKRCLTSAENLKNVI